MGQAELCPSGTELTEDECHSAVEHASDLGITLGDRKIVANSWGHVPPHCSYQHKGDQAYHFNRKNTNNVAAFINGQYRMICKNGKYKASLKLLNHVSI